MSNVTRGSTSALLCVLACVGTHARMHACPPNIDIGTIRKEHGKTWETNLLVGEWKTASTSKLCMSHTTHPEKGESCIASGASDSSDPPACTRPSPAPAPGISRHCGYSTADSQLSMQ